MKSGVVAVLSLTVFGASSIFAADVPPGVTNMGNVRGGDVQAARGIIEKRCTVCHSGKLIDTAMTANKDMLKIQQEMEKKGATLNANEREVLGIYWTQQNPLKKQK